MIKTKFNKKEKKNTKIHFTHWKTTQFFDIDFHNIFYKTEIEKVINLSKIKKTKKRKLNKKKYCYRWVNEGEAFLNSESNCSNETQSESLNIFKTASIVFLISYSGIQNNNQRSRLY